MRDYNFYVYILTNWNNKVMYVGMTNNLKRRMYEHKNKLVEGFTKKYNVDKLILRTRNRRSRRDCQRKRNQKVAAGKEKQFGHDHEP